MKYTNNKNNKDLEIQELAIEVMDMLCVALHFAGAKNESLQTLLDHYLDELDKIDENTPYNQEQMIALIKLLQSKYPQYFKA